ncbi:hypothetical protein OEZ85_002585 [Tetradesmus obliquus]|uniref:Uncharacterized protein n=1 Tax=Tetradesmus obliquus TaxID=3088 RepID=A0ABY8TXY4_TETOB|nr:hypothetical protein OEZ85_002585 [Tetradesmus obliquus]
MAAHNRGCGKGAYTKGNYKNKTISSRVGSTTQALLKPATEVPAWDFPVSAKTYELFFYPMRHPGDLHRRGGHQWHQQRACLAAGGVAH